ncbi:hypothetical protein [Altererythrobacter lauratis]|uniref:Uncharacterized protein n=1 Tax=Alteraurantiacibacter lauratis TaxID=2054627 RepID=A0ABV7EFJ1_9SPHN
MVNSLFFATGCADDGNALHRQELAAKSALIPALILAQFPAGDMAELRVEGRCTYPELLARRAGPAARLVTCGEAT